MPQERPPYLYALRHPEWGWLCRRFVAGDGATNWTFSNRLALRFDTADEAAAEAAAGWPGNDRIVVHIVAKPDN